jgi:hypothetical protein
VIVLCQAFLAQNERRNKFRMVTIVRAQDQVPQSCKAKPASKNESAR